MPHSCATILPLARPLTLSAPSAPLLSATVPMLAQPLVLVDVGVVAVGVGAAIDSDAADAEAAVDVELALPALLAGSTWQPWHPAGDEGVLAHACCILVNCITDRR